MVVVPMPHALADPGLVRRRPDLRAADLMAAFADPSIAGIVATIGGEDAIRVLPHLDLDVIAAHPKPLLGFSDTTVVHLACLAAGVRSYYGPSVMSGFAENGGAPPYLVDSVRRTLFAGEPIGLVEPNPAGWTTERLDWGDPANQSIRRRLQPPEGRRALGGSGRARAGWSGAARRCWTGCAAPPGSRRSRPSTARSCSGRRPRRRRRPPSSRASCAPWPRWACWGGWRRSCSAAGAGCRTRAASASGTPRS